MISFFLIVEMTNASDVRGVPVLLRPVDGVSLCFKRLEYVVGVIFDHIIVNVAAFGAALGSGLNINCRHTYISLLGRLSLFRIGCEEAARISGGPGLWHYFPQTCAMEWHHSPLLQIIRAAPAPEPQRHLAVACWPSAQPAIIGLCAWVALATPTDMATANAATVKVLNILSSSLF
jgi:hypothetical protein